MVAEQNFERDGVMNENSNAATVSIPISTDDVESRNEEFAINDRVIQPGFTKADDVRVVGGDKCSKFIDLRHNASTVCVEDRWWTAEGWRNLRWGGVVDTCCRWN